MVIATGINSQWGKIKSALVNSQAQTPLQEKLDDMAATIGYIGMGAAALTFIAMIAIKVFVSPPHLADVTLFNHALDAFIIAVTIVVVAVPEGLPLAVTISLAFSTKQMLRDQNLIRHLQACETMGNATNICSDKTGTLTENRMSVVRALCADEPSADGRLPPGLQGRARDEVVALISACSTASFGPSDPDGSGGGAPKVIGNATEAAFLNCLRESGHDYRVVRESKNFGTEGGGRIFPFSSKKKSMSVVVETETGNYATGNDGEGSPVGR